MRFVRLNRVRVAFGAAVLILSSAAAMSVWSISRLIETAGWVSHTYRILDRLGDLLIAVDQSVTASRRFDIPGAEQLHEQAIRSIESAVRDLDWLTTDNARQQKHIGALHDLIAKMTPFQRRMMEVAQSEGPDEALAVYANGYGQLIDRIRNDISEMNTEERGLLARRAAEERRVARVSALSLMVGSLLGLGILFAVYYHLEREIGRRRSSEARLVHLNRLYAVLSQANQTIVRVRSRDELLPEVCRVAVEYGQFAMAWIGFPEPASGLIQPAAWWGREEGYLQQAHISVADEPAGRGPAGVALREGTHFVCNDIASDPRMIPWRDAALARGYVSAAAFPIRVRGSLLGTFAVYTAEPGLFDDETVGLLDEVASDLSFALETIEQEEQRRGAELELRRQAEILDQVHDSVVSTDIDGRVTTWNRGAERLFGYVEAEAIGRPISFLYPEDDREAFESAVVEPLRARGTHESEVRMRTKSGGDLYVHLSLSLLRGEGGEPLGMIAYSIDVTDARRAETALRESEERFRQMAETVDEVFWMEDVELSQVIYVSPAFERVWGRSRESLREAPHCFLAVHPDDRERVEAAVADLSREGEFTEEYRIVRPDGSIRWIWDRGFPIRDGDGRVWRHAGIAQDVTERREAENEVRRLNEELERRIIERTAQLAEVNSQLASRNEELARASRMKTEFLARISHELRTPLNSIAGFSDLLAEEGEGPLGESYGDYVRHVQEGSQHLLALVNDLLDLSRIEAGKIELVHEEFAAADAISEVLSVTRSLAEGKKVDLGGEVPAAVVVFADRTRFKQIFYNLLSNAVKFTPPRGRVRVSAELDYGEARFLVMDTGIGMPQEEHAAIFEEFHQVGRSTSGVKEGAGLGLSITKRLVELHGGRIWVESAPGEGSRFYFTMPAASAREGSPGNPSFHRQGAG